MLDLIRRNANSWMTWMILGGIIVVFIFFFGASGSLPGGIQGAGTVAIVDGDPISGGEYRFAFANTEGYYKQVFGGDIPEQFNETMKESSVQQLIGQRLQAHASQQYGLAVGDLELASRIKATPLFFDESGNFSALRYERMREGMRSQYRLNFEETLSEQFLGEAALSVVGTPGPESDAAAKRDFLRERSTWTFDVVRIPNTADNAEQLAADLRDIFADESKRTAFLEEHKLATSTPATLTVSRYTSVLGNDADEASITQLFSLETGEVCPAGLTAGSDFVVCQLSERSVPETDAWDEAREQYLAQRSSRRAGNRAQAWLDELGNDANIIRYDLSTSN